MRRSEIVARLLLAKTKILTGDWDEAIQIIDVLIDDLELDVNELKRVIHAQRKRYPIGSSANLAYHELYEKLKEAANRGIADKEFLRKIKHEVSVLNDEIEKQNLDLW